MTATIICPITIKIDADTKERAQRLYRFCPLKMPMPPAGA